MTVLNPLGTGVIENPALTGLLGTLAPVLLGEELALRGPETWWCGRPDGLEPRAGPPRTTCSCCPVRPVAVPAPGGGLDACPPTDWPSLRDRIRARPGDWVGQEIIEPSTVPTVTDTGALEPRPAVIRTFAVADEHSDAPAGTTGYRILPGGLTRVGAESGLPDHLEPERRHQQGHLGGLRRAGPPAEHVAPLGPDDGRGLRWRPTPPPPCPAGWPPSCSSSAAPPSTPNSVIRLIRTVLARLDQPLGRRSGRRRRVAPGAARRRSGPSPDSTRCPSPTRRSPSDREPAGLPAQGSARVRPRSRDRDTRVPSPRPDPGRRRAPTSPPTGGHSPCCSTPAWTAAWSRPSGCWWTPPTRSGSSSRAIPGSWWATSRRSWPGCAAGRPPSWWGSNPACSACSRPCWPWPACPPRTWSGTRPGSFLDAGRRLERAQSLVRLLRAVLVRQRAGVVEDLLLESLLKTSESLIIFRRRSGSIMHVAGAVDLLVYDAANPRSVIFQLDRLFDHLADLPKRSPAQRLGDGEQLVLETTTMLRLTDASPAGRGRPRDPAPRRARHRARDGGRPAGRTAGQPALHVLRPRAPVGAGRSAARTLGRTP